MPRSLQKGPFIDGHLQKKVDAANATGSKNIIKTCISRGKRVVTATQMLESMAKNPRPTRAEVSDVANAVYDGTSAIMLSGETSVGKYPVETVEQMAAICADAASASGSAITMCLIRR